MEASAIPAAAGLARPRGRISGGPLLRLRSDEQLVRLFRQGNEEAFRVIHDRYRPRLFAYARQMLSGSRQDAEDALQDVFVRAYSALRANDRDVSLRAWLYRVAHNRCIDELRRPAPPPPETLELIQPSASDPIAEAEQRESLRRLVADVRRLPEQQRSALLMREIVGMSYTELASALDVTVPAVKSLLVRARIGLAQAAEARDTACASIREELTAAHDRGVRASGLAKRHLHDCAGCRAYKRELRSMRERFAVLTPALGVTGVVAKLLGLGGGGAAAGTGASAAAGGGAAAGSGVAAVGATAGGGLAVSATHVAAIVAAAAVAGGGAVEVQQTLAPVHHHASHHRTVVASAPSHPHQVTSLTPAAASAPVLPAPAHLATAPHAGAAASHGHPVAGAARATKKTIVARRTGPQTVALTTKPVTDETTSSNTTGGAAAPPDDQIDESTLPPVPYQAGDEADDATGDGSGNGTTDGTTDGTGTTGANSGSTGTDGSSGTATTGTGATGAGTGDGTSSSPASGATGTAQPPASSATTTAPGGGATATGASGGASATPGSSGNTAPPTAGLSGR